MTDYPRPTALVLFGVTTLAIAFGGISYLIIVRPHLRAARAASWPEVPCVITENQLRSSKDRDGKMHYEPVLRYRYEIDGVPHVGSRIDFGAVNQISEDDNYKALRPYPLGTTTSCRVNPADPLDSVLKPEVQGWLVAFFGVMFGTGFLGALYAFVIVWVRYFRLR